MAKHHSSYQRNIIWYMSQKNKLCIADLCRLLDCTSPTIYSYIDKPGLIRLKDLIILSGAFGISLETLVYCLNRTMVRIPPKKRGKEHKWFIDSKVLVGVKLVEEYERSLKE